MILALSIYPLIYSLWVAFVNYDFLVPGHAFVGLGNFARCWPTRCALHRCLPRLSSPALNVVVEFVLGLALALAMEQPSAAAAC